MKASIICLLAFVIVAKEIRGQTSSDEEKKQICVPGTHSKVDCNSCACSPDGTQLACTKIGCVKLPEESTRLRRAVPMSCKPNSSFMNDCNRCVCSSDGRSAACTYAACLPKTG